MPCLATAGASRSETTSAPEVNHGHSGRGLYNENLQRRQEFAIADLLGISQAGEVIGTNGNAYYGRITQSSDS